MKIMQD